MGKLIILLLMCCMGVVKAVLPENQEAETSSAPESLDADLQSVDSLAEITRNEVLPIIAFENADEFQLQFQMPEKLLKFELTADKKISNGTTFEARKPGNQIFLCPRNHEKLQYRCLVRQTFEGSVPLRCNSEPVLRWANIKVPCGGGEGTFFELSYEICNTIEYPQDPNNVAFYQICYNFQSHKTLFTDHEIKSSGLLNLNLLTRERSMDYPVTIAEEYYFISSLISKDKFHKEEGTSSINPSYQLQQMIPADDMAFATWRKTTFNNLNYQWQHEKLISLWDEIGKNIRSIVKNYTASGKEKFFVNTAIIDAPNSLPEGDNQLSNIWVKMISVFTPTLAGLKTSYGAAILMNNFIDNSDSSDLRDTPLKKYCDESFCIDELADQFSKIGGAIRCCPITSEILKIFDFEKNDDIKEIPIPNVTISKDQETLSDPITSEKAVASLREIQPSEMLPFIISFNRFDRSGRETFLVPTRIVKIETKNLRIVQGSQFAANSSMGNRLLCPKAAGDEKCLSPKAFGRYEPLQCTKEAVPLVREMSEDNKCGLESGGVIYNVVYQICTATGSEDMKFYKVCYNKDKNQRLYTMHRILSPRLIFSNLLLRERDMDHFTMQIDTSMPISDTQVEESVPGYKLQKLVPAEDMAFGLWKKTTYQRINADWQHEKLIPLWNKMNDHIRHHSFWHVIHFGAEQSQSKKYSQTDDNVEYYLYTGVFDVQYESQDTTMDDQKSNMWVKIISAKGPFSRESVVILMNNFLVKNGPISTSPNSKENIIQRYCEKSLCLQDFEKEFENIGGQIRCCALNGEITKLFGMEFTSSAMSVMSIPNVTQ